MNNMGIPVSRWIDGVLENKENIEQRDNIRAMFYWGHAVNSQTRGVEMKKAMDQSIAFCYPCRATAPGALSSSQPGGCSHRTMREAIATVICPPSTVALPTPSLSPSSTPLPA